MKILLDTANINEIKRCIDYYEIDGVTTNPSIIAKEGKAFIPHMKSIAKLIDDKRTLFVQVVATDYEGIIEDAKKILNEIDSNISVKIPVTKEGLKAMKSLSKNGFNIAATAIVTSQQGLMAAKCGAKYLIPYVNRVDNILGDGTNLVSEMMQMMINYNYNSEVIAASFKNIQQIHNCTLNGVHGVTISADLLDSLVHHSLTDTSVEQFTNDWMNAYDNQTSIRDEGSN
ncbi:fructose-6-phosphate aldolase [Alkalibaculum sp. M08DMB]|uniref:Fructose-6-phosphate aldolase n=1 Tax=Alkalibaculum sporogenes TaxID=2655001 RepID=A0A6A7K7N7_9FIRM|nr:transaldolase family protein [Alkalibaculum sporogenes]MPW25424.1 fructose-6-phosphate aldolase [Alkalibaculum sporogenes]